jgi:phosphoheptose isomerase|tara:strand:- start:426 stop:1406 length:981 start_codon:yes stop_codon:yes gene_type:complete
MAGLNFENIGDKFLEVTNTKEWAELQEKFNDCVDIFVLGHGGNLGVADHAAVDISRLSNGTKNAQAPGSGIVATSLINDSSFDDWMVHWVRQRTVSSTPEQLKKTMILGISSSGKSVDIIKALEDGKSRGMQVGIITSYPIPAKVESLTEVVLGAEYYHTSEVLTLLLTYELTHGSGKVCPPIFQNKPEDLELLNRQGGAAATRKHSYPDELVNIAVDFDGVIHKNSKGYHDGTVYDDPVEGAREALEKLSEKYTVIVYSAKARKDRGLVNGRSGVQLIWDWLKEHNLNQYVSKVTAEKPRAVAYIDDKGIEFDSWDTVLSKIDLT